jgi:hypothetical protein
MNKLPTPDLVTDDHIQMLDDLYCNNSTITLSEFAEICNITVPEASIIIASYIGVIHIKSAAIPENNF